jgi:hypothetical protein
MIRNFSGFDNAFNSASATTGFLIPHDPAPHKERAILSAANFAPPERPVGIEPIPMVVSKTARALEWRPTNSTKNSGVVCSMRPRSRMPPLASRMQKSCIG